MIDALIIRKTRTMKKISLRESKNDFTFEGGKYYIHQDKVLLQKKLIFSKPFLLYFEGIPLPIGTSDIAYTKNPKGKVSININSANLHEFVSSDILSVLTNKTLTKVEWVMLGLLVLTFLVSIAGVNY